MEQKLYRIGRFTLDAQRFELRDKETHVPIQPRVFSLLSYLIEHRGRIISREEIHDQVWSGRIVSDAAISSRIKVLRKLLQDDGKKQQIIKTVARRGYLLVADVEVLSAVEQLPGAEVPKTSPPSSRASTDTLPWADSMPLPDSADMGAGTSLLVMPMPVLGDNENAYLFSLGLTRDITTMLSQSHSMRVISRGTSNRLLAYSGDLQVLGEQLKVRFILSGQLQFQGSRFRLHAALTDTRDSSEIWAHSFDRNLTDVLELQAELGRAVAHEVEQMVHRAQMQEVRIHCDGLDAWGSYHRGLWHMYRPNPSDLNSAEAALAHSAQLDPRSSRPLASLSFVHWQRAFHRLDASSGEATSQAFRFAQESLTLNAKDPLAHFALARAFQLRDRLDEAIAEFDEALRLNPNLAMAHYARGLVAAIKNDMQQCEISCQKALSLSPYDPLAYAMQASRAIVALVQGRVDDAADLAEMAADYSNANQHRQVQFIAALCNSAANRETVAVARLKRLQQVSPGFEAKDYFEAIPIASDDTRALISNEYARLKKTSGAA